MEFTTIKNGVDNRLSIICHKESGYYNITKTAKLVHELMNSEAARDSVQPNRGPQVSHWLHNQQTKELFRACATLLDENVDDLKLEISTGPNKYRGTYIHPDMYDHFVAWIDPKYALMISHILKTYHQEANKKIIKEKDDKIDRLEKKIDEERIEARKRDEEAQKQIAKLLQATNTIIEQNTDLIDHVDDLSGQVDHVSHQLDNTSERLETAIDYLEEKSFTSTMNPVDENKHHYFAACVRKGRNYIIKLISGQRDYLNKTVDTLNLDGYSTLIGPLYNANGIDLRNNAVAEFKQSRTRVIDKINEQRKKDDDEYNKQLKIDINEHNKTCRKSGGTKRIYREERRYTPRLTVRDIPIKFLKTMVEYQPNPYITFEEVSQIITDTNNATQLSPMGSDDGTDE